MTPKSLVRAMALASGAVMFSTVVDAAPPVGFDSTFTVDQSSNITYTGCSTPTAPTSVTCSGSPITETGFYQTQVEIGGQTYFQTIVATRDATNPANAFTSESFVAAGNANGGISAQQNLAESATNAGTIATSTTINTGSVFNPTNAEATIDVGQTVTDGVGQFTATFGLIGSAVADRDGDGLMEQSTRISMGQDHTTTANDFAASFDYRQTEVVLSGTGTRVLDNKSMDVASNVLINAGGTTNDQTFAYQYRSGASVAAAGSAADGGATVGDWVAGDTVDRVLINQTVTGAGVFGFERLADLADLDGAGAADNTSSYTFSSLADPSPFTTISGSNPFATPTSSLP